MRFQSGDEITARDKDWTIVDRAGKHSYRCITPGGEEGIIGEGEIQTSNLTIGEPEPVPDWASTLSSSERQSNVAGMLDELEKIAQGLDPDAQVVIQDFVEQKRASLRDASAESADQSL